MTARETQLVECAEVLLEHAHLNGWTGELRAALRPYQEGSIEDLNALDLAAAEDADAEDFSDEYYSPRDFEDYFS